MMMRNIRIRLSLLLLGVLIAFGWLYLFNYMLFCQWKWSNDSSSKILLLADPQMEGDARIAKQGWYGLFNVYFNDYYFHHIVQNSIRYLQPTHIFVLGDLFSSQYITDREWEKRHSRYAWIFESAIASGVHMYNITGNHDIGYSGESSRLRIDRFERSFGLVNDQVIVNDHIIGILNSINIDESRDETLGKDVWDKMYYLKNLSESTGFPLIIMTHIPLHKDYKESFVYPNMVVPYHSNALCIEQPMTIYDRDNFIKVQNMLTPNSTDYIINTLKPRFIFTGHDHEGCIFLHTNNFTVEYTLRSMMGEFGGYAAMFEIKKSQSKCEKKRDNNNNNNNNENDNGNENDNNNCEDYHFEYNYTPCPFVTTDFINVFFVLSLVYLVTTTLVLCRSKFVHNNVKYKNK